VSNADECSGNLELVAQHHHQQEIGFYKGGQQERQEPLPCRQTIPGCSAAEYVGRTVITVIPVSEPKLGSRVLHRSPARLGGDRWSGACAPCAHFSLSRRGSGGSVDSCFVLCALCSVLCAARRDIFAHTSVPFVHLTLSAGLSALLDHRHPQRSFSVLTASTLSFLLNSCSLLHWKAQPLRPPRFVPAHTCPALMSFFGFDATLPRDRGHPANAPGFGQTPDPFAGVSRGLGDDDDDDDA
jgi:Topoisomerase II-associated protein PAT1